MQETKQGKSYAGRKRITKITEYNDAVLLPGRMTIDQLIKQFAKRLEIIRVRGEKGRKSPFHSFPVCFIGKRHTLTTQRGQKGGRSRIRREHTNGRQLRTERSICK